MGASVLGSSSSSPQQELEWFVVTNTLSSCQRPKFSYRQGFFGLGQGLFEWGIKVSQDGPPSEANLIREHPKRDQRGQKELKLESLGQYLPVLRPFCKRFLHRLFWHLQVTMELPFAS